MNGKDHFKILFIVTIQITVRYLNTNLRTNVDYVFNQKNFVNNRKRLYDHYAGMFPTFEMFCESGDGSMYNYECLVINNNAKSNKLENQVFWYKASEHDDFRLGAQKNIEVMCQNTGETRDDQPYGGYKNQYVVDKKY